MKLGDLIRAYRESHDLSQRQFANICELSNGYISILEKGINPNTGKPVVPTIPQLKKLASGMSMSMMEMFEIIDDMPIDIFSSCTSNGTAEPSPTPSAGTNIIRIIGRDGSCQERQLSDKQLALFRTILDLLPDDENKL